MTMGRMICTECIHWDKENPTSCEAFPYPKKIPKQVWFGSDKHNKPIAGDHGIQFEEKKDAA